MNEGRIDEAIEHWRRALEIEPEDAENQFSLGTALASRGRTEEALEHLQEALKLEPDYAAADSELGIVLDQEGKSDEALEHCFRAVELAPDKVGVLGNLGEVLLHRRDYDRAAAYFRKALAIQPGSAECDSILAWPWAGKARSTWPRRTAPGACNGPGGEGRCAGREDQGRDPPLRGLAVGGGEEGVGAS